MSVKDPVAGTPVSLPHPRKMLMIEALDYTNPYDFQRMHRHEYFEIILVREGTGQQRIDFSLYEMKKGSVYTVYPGQLHLMERGTANGLLIQFRKEIFELIPPLKHYFFYFNNAAVLTCDVTFQHLYELATRMQSSLNNEQLTSLSIFKVYSYLQVMLITLVEHCSYRSDYLQHNLVAQYLSLVTTHIHTKKKVGDYCSLLGCNAEKLNKACRESLGKTALEIIHEEVMLEIRRLMALGGLSLKEIAFELNFDAQQNFSAFVKQKTGLAPSELLQAVRKIH